MDDSSKRQKVRIVRPHTVEMNGDSGDVTCDGEPVGVIYRGDWGAFGRGWAAVPIQHIAVADPVTNVSAPVFGSAEKAAAWLASYERMETEAELHDRILRDANWEMRRRAAEQRAAGRR